jgi:hypothetical protein
MNLSERGMKSASELAIDKPHGTRIKYIGGCKCMLCRAANSRYETERHAARKAGDWNGIVDTDKARRHLKMLSRNGVGRRAVADASDIAGTILSEIRSGKRKRIRARTERKILAVTKEALSGGALVDADLTWKKIDELLDEGFTKGGLALRLGMKTLALQIKRFEVTAKTQMRVDRFYRQIMAE